MAISYNNTITKGLSGAIGNLVFRQLGGKTIITHKTQRKRKESAQQKENRMRFKDAARWAKCTLLDPEKKAYYVRKAKKLKLSNAYTAAVCDYMRKGEIKEIDIRNFKGKAGDVIRINTFKKDFAINKVKVTFCDAAGVPIESYYATKRDQHLFICKYEQTHPDKLPVSIFVTIDDLYSYQVRKDMRMG